ncbi:MAG: FkbM family methyltransferase [Planctomycetota bacterium]
MRMHRLGRLFSLDRYRRCRELFAHPARAHLALTGVTQGPFTLEFKRGGRLDFPKFRKVRGLWTYLFEDPQRLEGLHVEDGALGFPFEGTTIYVRPVSFDFPIFTEVFLEDVYRLQTLGELETVVDLGANVGLFSTRAAMLGAGRVIAIEPVSENRALAQRHFRAAGVEDRVTLVGKAVTGTSGETVAIHLSAENSGAHSVDRDMAKIQGDAGVETVETISLEDLFAEHGVETCDLLKCDVEGAEFEIVLATPPEVLGRVRRLAMEVHLTPDTPAERYPALKAHLEASGFALEEEEGPLFEGYLQQYMLTGTR